MKREFSAGGTVFKRVGDNVFWIITKPRPSRLIPSKRFQLPKGHIEQGETPEVAALREVLEETGTTSKIVSKIGYAKYSFTAGDEKIFKVVTYFLMEYVSGELAVNDEVEELYWLSFDESMKKLTNSSEKNILQKASELLNS